MSDTEKKPLRVLFCMAVLQNFFDLPNEEIGNVFKSVNVMLADLAAMEGVTVLGTMDDDMLMVGTSPNGWPWTCYVLADCADIETVTAACGLFRTTPVGDTHRLWRYMRIEARVGRPLDLPNPA